MALKLLAFIAGDIFIVHYWLKKEDENDLMKKNLL